MEAGCEPNGQELSQLHINSYFFLTNLFCNITYIHICVPLAPIEGIVNQDKILGLSVGEDHITEAQIFKAR